jgi:hypothetical protein
MIGNLSYEEMKTPENRLIETSYKGLKEKVVAYFVDMQRPDLECH